MWVTAVANPLPHAHKASDMTGHMVCRDHTLLPGKAIYVEGSIPELGSWRERKGLRLKHRGAAAWVGDIQIASTAFPFTYKYAISCCDGLIPYILL